MARKTAAKKTAPTKTPKRRQRLSQTDVPGCSLDQALRVPQAIAEHYAYEPSTPLRVAKAMKMQPNSGAFRQICGAAIAYGLTEGGPNASEIQITPVGMRIVRPLEDGDDLIAKREAFLKPRVIGEFINKYDSAPLPRHDIALNVLEDMGVPRGRAESVFTLILDGAAAVGFVTDIKGKQYIEISAAPGATDDTESLEGSESESTDLDVEEEPPKSAPSEASPSAAGRSSMQHNAARRVFITHGKDKSIIDPIKKLLGFGEMIAVVSTERQSVSKPVPDKVMDDMRSCGAAIIHVSAEKTLLDKEANEHAVVNPNVLIEIGAAMALYGRRFILLVKDGVQLPSNLQGLYEVRYSGDTLDGDSTIRLLEAINDIKNNPLPDRYHKDGKGG